MSIHLEVAFEREVCEHLASHGWLGPFGRPADKTRAIFATALVFSGLGPGQNWAKMGQKWPKLAIFASTYEKVGQKGAKKGQI